VVGDVAHGLDKTVIKLEPKSFFQTVEQRLERVAQA
jgi:hypothetical protein